MRFGVARGLGGHIGFHGIVKGPIIWASKRTVGAFADAVREHKESKTSSSKGPARKSKGKGGGQFKAKKPRPTSKVTKSVKSKLGQKGRAKPQ